MTQTTDASNQNWKPGWLFYAALAVIVIIFFQLYPLQSGGTSEIWQEEEQTAFLQSCRSAALASDTELDDYELSVYCSCSLMEFQLEFPESSPSFDSISRSLVESVTEKCMEAVEDIQQ